MALGQRGVIWIDCEGLPPGSVIDLVPSTDGVIDNTRREVLSGQRTPGGADKWRRGDSVADGPAGLGTGKQRALRLVTRRMVYGKVPFNVRVRDRDRDTLGTAVRVDVFVSARPASPPMLRPRAALESGRLVFDFTAGVLR